MSVTSDGLTLEGYITATGGRIGCLDIDEDGTLQCIHKVNEDGSIESIAMKLSPESQRFGNLTATIFSCNDNLIIGDSSVFNDSLVLMHSDGVKLTKTGFVYTMVRNGAKTTYAREWKDLGEVQTT